MARTPLRPIWIICATGVSGALYGSCKSVSDPATLRDAQEPAVATTSNEGCAGFDDAVGDPVEWLKQQSQGDLQKIFRCAPPSTSVPIGLGIGRGSVFQDWPLWNDLQTQIGSYVWGGKRLYLQPDGQPTCLLNEMTDSQTERYMAHVYIQNSSSDGRPAVVLDYRVDDTQGLGASPAQLVVDRIIHGIRDEIREVTQNGSGTHVFIGRANIKKSAFAGADLGRISDADFTDPSEYLFGANFFLDFRPSGATAFGTATPTCMSSETDASPAAAAAPKP
jgi:hypothetical protein